MGGDGRRSFAASPSGQCRLCRSTADGDSYRWSSICGFDRREEITNQAGHEEVLRYYSAETCKHPVPTYQCHVLGVASWYSPRTLHALSAGWNRYFFLSFFLFLFFGLFFFLSSCLFSFSFLSSPLLFFSFLFLFRSASLRITHQRARRFSASRTPRSSAGAAVFCLFDSSGLCDDPSLLPSRALPDLTGDGGVHKRDCQRGLAQITQRLAESYRTCSCGTTRTYATYLPRMPTNPRGTGNTCCTSLLHSLTAPPRCWLSGSQ